MNRFLIKFKNLETKKEIMAYLEMHSGPIPLPDILEGYQKLYPNAAKEII